MIQAIRAMGTSDFWTLRSGQVLPDETKNYIPAIQAATLIAREPERYGFVFTPAEPLSYEVVMAPRGTSLKRLAARSDIPIDVFEQLNTELKLKQTPPDGPYPLKVPVGVAKLVRVALEREAPACNGVIARARHSSRQGNSAADGARRQAPRDRGRDREALRSVRG